MHHCGCLTAVRSNKTQPMFSYADRRLVDENQMHALTNAASLKLNNIVFYQNRLNEIGM
jgi:hypothetical protein